MQAGIKFGNKTNKTNLSDDVAEFIDSIANLNGKNLTIYQPTFETYSRNPLNIDFLETWRRCNQISNENTQEEKNWQKANCYRVTGDFENGRLEGDGALILGKDIPFQQGTYRKGKLEGEASRGYIDYYLRMVGEIGTFVNDLLEGNNCTRTNSIINEEGSFLKGKLHGNGTEKTNHWSNEGIFFDGSLIEGTKSIVDVDIQKISKGKFNEKEKLTGQGKETLVYIENNQVKEIFEGSFKNGKRDGKGVLLEPGFLGGISRRDVEYQDGEQIKTQLAP